MVQIGSWIRDRILMVIDAAMAADPNSDPSIAGASRPPVRAWR